MAEPDRRSVQFLRRRGLVGRFRCPPTHVWRPDAPAQLTPEHPAANRAARSCSMRVRAEVLRRGIVAFAGRFEASARTDQRLVPRICSAPVTHQRVHRNQSVSTERRTGSGRPPCDVWPSERAGSSLWSGCRRLFSCQGSVAARRSSLQGSELIGSHAESED